jgi:O-antigen ligase
MPPGTLAELKRVRYPVETGLLLALAIFLPLFEAPKNLLWVAYAVTWIANRARARDFGGRWDLWDTLIALWIASGFVVAALAGLHKSEWRGAGDLLRYGSLLWLVKRGGYSGRELVWLLGALVASTVIGLAYGYVRLWTGIGKSGTLQLHSVGHVNHTAIYLAIVLGVCAAWIFARWNSWRGGQRAVAMSVAALVLVSLVVTASRGAVGIGLVTLAVLALAWWPRWRAPVVAMATVLAVSVALMFTFGAEIVRKQEDRERDRNVLAFRDGVWRQGLAAWERYPWFGVGMDNYSLISLEQVRAWRTEAGKPYEASRYVYSPHAHSLYVNTLAERGVAGAAALGAVLLAWIAWLLRFRPQPRRDDHAWLLWGGAASAWLVTVGAGTVNTTLHHEHGILAALLLGAWLGYLEAQPAA